MEFFPRLSRKPVDQCEPGELIRLEWGSGNPWAFIAADREARMVTFLSDLPDTVPPRYARLPDATEYVLSCGNDWRIKINQDTANVDLTASRFYKRNGTLVLEDDRHLLFVEPFRPSEFTVPVYVDFASGKLVERPKGPAAIFLRWSLDVHMGSDRFETLVSLPVEADA